MASDLTASRSSSAGDWPWGWIYAGLAGLSILLELLVRTPVNWDFWTHEARLAVLAAGPDDPLRGFYEVEWAVIPNLGIDLAYQILAPLLAPEAVMRLLCLLAVVAEAAGLWSLHRSLFPRSRPALLLGSVCLYNLCLIGGQINFVFSMSLMLAALGGWLRLRQRPWPGRLLLFNALAVVLFFLHAAALAALLLCVGLVELAEEGRGLRERLRAGLTVPVFFAAGLLLIPLAQPWDRLFSGGTTKLVILAAPFLSGIEAVDKLLLCAWLFLLYYLGRSRQGRIDRRLRWPLAGLAVAVLLIPPNIGAASFVDSRLAVVAAFVFFAGLDIPDRRVERRLAGLALAATLLKLGLMLPAWLRYDADIADFRRLADQIPLGSRVLVTMRRGESDQCAARSLGAYQHLPDLLVGDRHAYVSTLATGRGMQPVHLRPEWREDLALPWTAMDWGDIEKAESGTPLAIRETWPPRLTRWRHSFDRVIFLHLGCTGWRPEDPALVPLADSGVAAVYAVRP